MTTYMPLFLKTAAVGTTTLSGEWLQSSAKFSWRVRKDFCFCTDEKLKKEIKPEKFALLNLHFFNTSHYVEYSFIHSFPLCFTTTKKATNTHRSNSQPRLKSYNPIRTLNSTICGNDTIPVKQQVETTG